MCRSYPALPTSCQLSGFPTTAQTKGQWARYKPDIVKFYRLDTAAVFSPVRKYSRDKSKAGLVSEEIDSNVILLPLES